MTTLQNDQKGCSINFFIIMYGESGNGMISSCLLGIIFSDTLTCGGSRFLVVEEDLGFVEERDFWKGA